MHPWTPELRELRDRVAAWHLRKTGRAVLFNVALLNRYDDGGHSLGYHADREEMDPGLCAPRASPIASVSLGCERMFGFRRTQLPPKHRARPPARGGGGAAAREREDRGTARRGDDEEDALSSPPPPPPPPSVAARQGGRGAGRAK